MRSTTAESTTIEREIVIAAPPEIVWSFLVDPEKAASWMGIAVELDARPGGVYRVEVMLGQVARGEFEWVRLAPADEAACEAVVLEARGFVGGRPRLPD